MERQQLRSQGEKIVANNRPNNLMHTFQLNCNESGEKGDANTLENRVTHHWDVCRTAAESKRLLCSQSTCYFQEYNTDFTFFDTVTERDIFQFILSMRSKQKQTRISVFGAKPARPDRNVDGLLANDPWLPKKKSILKYTVQVR